MNDNSDEAGESTPATEAGVGTGRARGGDGPLRRPRPAREGEPKRPSGERRAAPEGERPAGPDSEPGGEARPPTADERIAKVIARAGVASRRDAEAMIEAGRVTLNGAPVLSPALNVGPEDRITVDGEPLPLRERTRLWLFHKPRGLVTTFRDPQGRPTVFDALPEELPRVVAIGRLDINTEGLLLLTNDGGLAKVIAHPDTGWTRRYRVRARGEVTQEALDTLRRGVTVDEMEYGPIEAHLDRVQGDNAWLTLSLKEGKNREVKRVLEHLGLQVNRLIRVSFGPFQLGEIEPGLVEEVRTRVLKDQLGRTLAAQAEVDFESPVREPIAPFGAPAAGRPEGHPVRPGRAVPPRRAGEGGRGGDVRGGRDPRPERAAAPGRGRPTVPRTSWRSADEDAAEPRRRRPARRDDPKAERANAATRPRERAGSIEGAEGRRIKVERMVRDPRPDEARAPRHRDVRPPRGSDARPEGRGQARDARGPGRDRPGRGREDAPAGRESRSRFGRDRPSGDRGPGAGPPRGGPAKRPGSPRPGSADRPFRGKPRGDGDEARSAGRDRPSFGRSGGPPRAGPPGRGREGGDRPGGSRPGGPRPGGGRKGGPGSRPR